MTNRTKPRRLPANAIDAQKRVPRDHPDADRKRAKDSTVTVNIHPNGGITLGKAAD